MYRHAQRHFKKTDPILYKASLEHDIPDITRSKNVFRDLVRAIVNQQLSGKAADTIFGRIEAALKKRRVASRSGRTSFTPERILSLSPKQIRACGLSKAKVKAIHSLARASSKGEIDLVKIHLLDDAAIVETLTRERGIGPWTAEMIMMFSLGRKDIFSKGDLGLQKGIMQLYGLAGMPTNRLMDKLSRTWSPYRTYAARILWRVADQIKVRPKGKSRA
ncbi:MAG: DNA-3-methyladenine glycosylase [Candidatus Parcubacteria bacterium]|jgi:3-methyladenine DNA glycosylase/8-oxoguanine DNA glycosylase|nr:DNA-3-methyladenine glycosylase [Candidatus Parcubacteria bacterium]